MTVQLNLEDKNVEQHFLSPGFRVHVNPPSPPVKVYQMPEDPVDTREVKRKWDNLLYTAAKKLIPFGETYIHTKRDTKGVVALEYPDFILVAKNYLWKGFMVSIHETVLNYAVRKTKPVVMYIHRNNWFMKLDAKRVLEDFETKDNIRGNGSHQRMKNFNINIGERVFLPQTKLEVKK